MADTRKNASETINETTEAGRETVDAAAGVVQEAAVVGLDGVRRMIDQFTEPLALPVRTVTQ
jgi:hypothetical protein